MKKKSFGKKLSLSKGTVANLSNMELNKVKGGRPTVYCGTSPDCTVSCDGTAASVKYTSCETQCCTIIECTVDWGC